MFDPVKHLGQGEESRDAGEDSLRPGRSESSPAARPTEGDLGPGRRGGFAAGASPGEEPPQTEFVDVEPRGEGPSEAASDDSAPPLPPNLTARRRGGPLRKRAESRSISTTPEQRVLLLDTWQRSGLPAGDFAALVGVSKCTLFTWKKRFEELGPAGLLDQPRGGPKGSRLPELTKRTILMLKQSHPEWGCQRISVSVRRNAFLRGWVGWDRVRF